MGHSKPVKRAKLATLSLSSAIVVTLASQGAVAVAAETQVDHSVRQAAVSRMASRLGGLRGSVDVDQRGVFLSPQILERQRAPRTMRDRNIPGGKSFDLEPTGSTSSPEKKLPIVMNDLPSDGLDTMATGSIAPAGAISSDTDPINAIKTSARKRAEPGFEIILTEENVDWPPLSMPLMPSLPSVSFAPIINLPKTLSKIWNAERGPSVIIPLKQASGDYPTRG